MKRQYFSVFAILAIVLTLVTSPVLAAPAAGRAQHPGAEGLRPGEIQTFEQKIPVQVIFLGYDQQMIDRQALLGQLPASSAPVVRYPRYYGLQGRDMGLKFTFDYRVSFTGSKLTKEFFKYLKKIGSPGAPTDFQSMYNAQQKNVLDVTGPVLYIDGPSVENWLVKNLPNINPRGYTIVFVNWYGRPDFQFHVYTKTDVVDPDTGYNFGEVRASRKMIAWGGTTSRLWFYDLSAGPEAWTNNWVVDSTDLDGNGVENYRMPPIWEYTAGGYRDPLGLSSDLGRVTRFVAINLLFAASPLYDPLVTAPGLGGNKVVHINMMEDDPASAGLDWFNKGFSREELQSFEPYYDWRVKVRDYNPIDPDAQRALRIWSGVGLQDDCWNNFGTNTAELFCYFDANRSSYLPSYGATDYVAGIQAFNTTVANMGPRLGLLGFADDNWASGTQSYVFAFDTDYYRSLGYGFSTTVVHETGHHIGLSHPHDGYDSEMGLDYGADDAFYYSWSGDESNTIMHYMDLTEQFGRFDRDNMYRWEMAGYLNWSNELMGNILAHPKANRVKSQLAEADRTAAEALRSFRAWDYLRAVTKAYRTYQALSAVADRLGIENPADLMAPMSVGGTAPHEGDPIRFPDN